MNPMTISDQRRRIERRCEIEKFCEAVESLPPKNRIIFRLYFRDGESLKSIGEVCGVCKGTITRRLQKIGKEIEEMLYGNGVAINACSPRAGRLHILKR